MLNLEYQYLSEAAETYSRQQDIANALGVSQPTVTRLLKKHDIKL